MHPKSALNGCDYYVTLGHSRQCKFSDMFDKYTYSNPEQRKELNIMQQVKDL